MVEVYGFNFPKKKLKALSLLEVLDPDEKFSSYKKNIYQTLKLLAKDKDAEIYLNSSTSMENRKAQKGSHNIVIASILGEEVYYQELERIQNNYPKGTPKKELMTQLLAKKLLQKESEPLLQDPAFKKIANQVLLDFRISHLMDRALSQSITSEFDLKNYYQATLYNYVFTQGFLISHLLIKDQDVLNEFLDKKVLNLPDFEKFVDLYSIDLNKNKKGKISKWIDQDFIPLIGKVAGLMDHLKSQKRNVLSDSFKSPKGTHFFWLHESREAQNIKYEDAKEMLKKSYKAENQQILQEKYFQELFTKYKVVVHEDRL